MGNKKYNYTKDGKKKMIRVSKYTATQVRALIRKLGRYRLCKNGPWPNSVGYRFTYRTQVAEALGCSIRYLDKLFKRFNLRGYIDDIQMREKARHQKREAAKRIITCTLCNETKDVTQFGKFSRLTLCGRRKICRTCLNNRDNTERRVEMKRTYKFRNPEAYARTIIVQDIKREHDITVHKSELSDDMVEAKMRAIDLHREKKKKYYEREEEQVGKKRCSACKKIQLRNQFKKDYERMLTKVNGEIYYINVRSFRCFTCRKKTEKKNYDKRKAINKRAKSSNSNRI